MAMAGRDLRGTYVILPRAGGFELESCDDFVRPRVELGFVSGEIHPDPPLLPAAALARARVRALSQAITCDVHPLNNLRVLRGSNPLRDLGSLRSCSAA
jgi:hypothetical protein